MVPIADGQSTTGPVVVGRVAERRLGANAEVAKADFVGAAKTRDRAGEGSRIIELQRCVGAREIGRFDKGGRNFKGRAGRNVEGIGNGEFLPAGRGPIGELWVFLTLPRFGRVVWIAMAEAIGVVSF
jgi:hypothetical protein